MFPPGAGGLNLKANPLGLGPEYLIEAQNVEYVTAGARSKRKGQQKINSEGLVEDSPVTYVDQDSASGQKVLYLNSTTGFGAGEFIAIDRGGANEEYNRIASVSAGSHLTLENNLSNTHLGGDESAEQQISSLSDRSLRSSSNDEIKAQGVQHDGSGKYLVTKVDVSLKKNGSPTGEFWIEIWGNGGSNEPDSGNVLSAKANSSKLDVSTVAGSQTVYTITFSTPVELDLGTPYHLVYQGDYTINGTDYLDVGSSPGDNYRGTSAPFIVHRWDGATWNTHANQDFYFVLYKAIVLVEESAAVTGYLDFVKNSQQQIIIVAASNGNVYTESGGTLTERLSGLAQGKDVLWVMTVFKDNAIVANQNDAAYYTPDGVSFTAISDPNLPTTAGLPAAWRNRLCMADGDTLYYSTLDSFTDWTTTGGEIPILHGKGPITAIIPFGKVLVVAKADSITLVTGSTPDDFAVQNLPGEVGIAGPQAWAQVANDILFVSLEDVSSLQTVIDFADIKAAAVSRDIEPFIRDEVNPNRRRYIQCAYYPAKSQFWLVFADRNSTIEDRALVFDVVMQGWSHAKPVFGHVLATKRNSLGERQLIVGGHDGFLKRLDTNDDDDGDGIATIFKTPHLDLGRPNQPKGWRKLILFTKGRGATLLVDYEIDFQPAGSLSFSVQGFGDPLGSGAGSFQLGSSKLGGGESFQHHEALLVGSGHFCSFKFTNTGANEPFTLLGMGVEAQPEGTDKWAP